MPERSRRNEWLDSDELRRRIERTDRVGYNSEIGHGYLATYEMFFELVDELGIETKTEVVYPPEEEDYFAVSKQLLIGLDMETLAALFDAVDSVIVDDVAHDERTDTATVQLVYD